jgi:hypothetical protein
VRNPEQTRLAWYAEAGADTTTVWANFQGADPNVELVEINVRRSVFYPADHHIDYITVRGFELAQAACPWTPPTADQPGLIGPNWAKGWIIEDNVIHDAKCSAVSLGKEASTGHNYATLRGDKPHPAAGYGTAAYDGSPTSLKDYIGRIANPPEGNYSRIPGVKEPAYLRDNVYAPGASAFAGESSALALAGEVSFEVVEDGDEVYLQARLPESFSGTRTGVVTGADLPRPRLVDADFEERDGTPAVIDVDLLGERKDPAQDYPAGPIAALAPGKSRIRVW